MSYQILKEKDYKINYWVGGETSELYIYPEGSNLKERDFDFRISSAVCNEGENKFSDFSGYIRYITPLNAELELLDEGKKINLKPFEIYQFDGSDEVISKSQVKDFNLILKKGLTGSLRSETVEGISKFKISGGINLIYNFSEKLRFKACGKESILEPGDSIIFGKDEIIIELEPCVSKSTNILVVEVEI